MFLWLNHAYNVISLSLSLSLYIYIYMFIVKQVKWASNALTHYKYEKIWSYWYKACELFKQFVISMMDKNRLFSSYFFLKLIKWTYGR